MRFVPRIPLRPSPTRRGAPSRGRRAATPRLEPLEVRAVPSTVNSIKDDGSPGTLRDVLANAKSGDVIVFDAAIQNQTIHLAGQALSITKGVTITGPITVDAGGQGSVFSINDASGPVTINSLTITGGSTVIGGGIYDRDTALTLNNDTVTNNQAIGLTPGASAYGGGVAVLGSGASLSANTVQFIWDRAEGAEGGSNPMGDGRGGDGEGGAIWAGYGTGLSLSGCTFQNNLATGGKGGSGGSGTSWNDGGGGYGGAIDTFGNALSANNCNFSGDAAQGGWGSVNPGPPHSSSSQGGPAVGGGVAVLGSSAMSIVVKRMGVTWTSMPPSTTCSLTFNGDKFTHETAQGGRGGIDSDSGGSLANGGGGLAIGGAIGDLSLIEDLAMQSCTFNASQALGGRGAGGGSVVGGAGGPAVGAAIATFGQLTVTGNVGFSGSTALGGPGGDVSAEGPGGAVFGGTLFVDASLNLNGATFSGNVATGGDAGAGDSALLGAGGPVIGGVVDAQGWESSWAPGNALSPTPLDAIASSQFLNNTSHGGRGGDTKGGTRTIAGTGGDVWGGDVSAFGLIAISGTMFSGGHAYGGRGGNGVVGAAGSVAATGGAGGHVRGGSLALLNDSVKAGAVKVSDSLMNVDVVDVIAQGGRGGDGYAGGTGGNVIGGGAYLAAGPDDPVGWVVASFTGGEILDDVAQAGQGGVGSGGAAGVGGFAYGGGLDLDFASTIAIEWATIQGNQADGGFSADGKSRGWGIGGGVYLTGPGSTKQNTTITGNSASAALGNDVYGAFS